MMSTPGRRHARFLLAVVVLGAGAGFMQEAKSRGWLRIVKKPLPIRKPLKDMDRACLQPFRFVVSQRLPADTETELGATQYIDWVLELSEGKRPWAGQTGLSVSYYTGKQDQVPHVPEECLHQGGFSPAGGETIEMELPRAGRTIPVRRLCFFPPRDARTKLYIYYTICANNDFFSRRNAVRVRMADPRDTHLFYSKVEFWFEGVDERKLSRLDELARDLMDSVVSEMVRSHWPRKGWERGGPPALAGESRDS